MTQPGAAPQAGAGQQSSTAGSQADTGQGTNGPQAGAGQQNSAPPWGDNFDAEKAWGLVQALRADKEKLQARPALTDEAQQKIAEFDRLAEASKTDVERAQESLARQQAETERWRGTAVQSSILAQAAADFVDPSDAAAALSDPGKYVDVSGVIDTAAIKADLDSLLQAKPHWRRQEGGPAPRTPVPNIPVPNGAQGASGAPVAGDPAAQFAQFLQGQMRS